MSRTPIQFEEFYNAGVLTPLDELAANVGYDMETVYSGAAVKFDGQTYALPAERDIWLTYYNTRKCLTMQAFLIQRQRMDMGKIC